MRPSRYDLRIYSNPDAFDWAKFFIEQNPNVNVDEETMFTWFANAMQAMKNHIDGNGRDEGEEHDLYDDKK